MPHRHRIGTLVGSACIVVLFGIVAMRAQDKPLVAGASKIDPLFTVDLAQVGLSGASAAQRVTIAPGIMTADHTHTGRTSILVMTSGAITEVRGAVKNEYKAGDVVAVAEGTTHHAENHGTVPAVYIEINTSAKK